MIEKKYLILAVFCLSTFSYYFALQSVPPVIPQIMNSFSVTYTETGLLMFWVALPALFLSLPAGIMNVKLGPRKVGGLGLMIATAGAFITYLTLSFPMLMIGRFILGLGGILIIISGFTGVSHWFTKDELGKIMGIYGLNMPFAIVIALNLVPRIASEFGWRTSFLIATGLLFLSILAFIFLIEERPFRRQVENTFHGIKNKQLWILAAIWGLFVLVYMSYVTWAGTFFTELKNIPINMAFFLASFITITAIPLTPIAGRLSDKLGKRKIFLTASSAGMVISFLLIPGLSLPLLFLPIALLSISAAFLPPALFALPSEILSPKMAGLGYGVLYTCWSMGITTGPAFIGYIRDTFTGEVPIYVAMAIFSFLAMILASLLKTR